MASMAQISRVSISSDRKKPTLHTFSETHIYIHVYIHGFSWPRELEQFGGGLKVFFTVNRDGIIFYCPTSNANTFIGCPNMLGQESFKDSYFGTRMLCAGKGINE